ncbi:MAG: prolyl oligopeptidase family serine peptidase [Acidimicrobiia bacterium]|nr:prolyl oligopeptidase family serine peptidase [Acidimicrobiia bacterium]
MAFTYPPTRRADTVDYYHGTPVADPYRWLENSESEDTKAFVQAQNEITLPFLASLRERSELRERMEALWDVARTGAPTVRNGIAVWPHNDGLQDQPVLFVRRPDHEDRVLLDPNVMSEDGAIAVIVTSLSDDGRLLAYSIAESGSDWQTIRIRDTETGDDLSDELHHVKFTEISWYDSGFFYSRFPAHDPASIEPSRNMAVHYHTLGTDQDKDTLVFANPDDPDLGYGAAVSDDHRFLILTEWQGTSHKNGLLYKPLDDPDADWVRLASPGEALYAFLAHHQGAFLLHTDLEAPNGRIVRLSLDRPEAINELAAERHQAIELATSAAGCLIAITLNEASHRIHTFDLDGTPTGSIDLPGAGTVAELTGRLQDDSLYLGFQSFLYPPTALRWDGATLEVFAGAAPPLDPNRVIVERRRAVSSDGAEVGMFIIRLTTSVLPAPVELYGYGGFNISLTPMFHPARLAFLEAGGVVAVANLRGGSELGETWHEAGMLGNKQQVFDDLFACAETLIADGVAGPAQVGIRGGSNGGLLTAAAMVQRPDLFGAVIAQVPVTDMLRYQHFTAGRYWTVEYGDADKDEEAFTWLLAYSPYHNIAAGISYPPLLITTAESDDRVVPMHSLKFAAAVQHAAGGNSEQPLLVRVETRAGHGLGKPTSKLIDESADIFAFLLHHLAR